ncbi:MAG: CotH kinase family protein [Clostridia bacterium]|nr:CotH kinase family protein [Clostridia bacterium]
MKRIAVIICAFLFCALFMCACSKEYVTVKNRDGGKIELTVHDDTKKTVTLAPNYDCSIRVEPVSGKDEVTILENPGYKLLYYEVNGEKIYDSSIDLSDCTDGATVNVVMDYATYELPIVNIDTDGKEIVTKSAYYNMTFSLTNTDKELENVKGGIRLRGNATLLFPKKAYRMEFTDKQGLFGHKEARSWVLLADYLDPSALNNYAAFSLGAKSDAHLFTPTAHKVNVYINGDFRGLYTLCELIEEEPGRLGIEQRITGDMMDLKDFNFLVSMDKYAVDDPDARRNETYFYIESIDKYFELKYPTKKDFVSEYQFRQFFSQLVLYYEDIIAAFQNGDIEKIKSEVNVDSLVDYLIIDQIMGEKDHYWKSFNMFYIADSSNEKASGKLNFGPVWDYDWALYTPYTEAPNQHYEIGEDYRFTNFFYMSVMENPELYNRVEQRYNGVFAPALAEVIADLKVQEGKMTESYNENQKRWYSSTPDITEKNIDFLNRYLDFRLEFLKEKWSLDK